MPREEDREAAPGWTAGILGNPAMPPGAPPGVFALWVDYFSRPSSTARASCLTESSWRSSSWAFSSWASFCLAEAR